MVDPRDVAMQEVQQAAQPKGAVLPMTAAKGVTAITVGIGAKPNHESRKGRATYGCYKERSS